MQMAARGLACTRPGCQTSRKAALTSETLFASFVSLSFFSGIFQLFTPHHHLRTFAPTLCPLNLADRFQCRQPLRISVHTTPCAKHMRTLRGQFGCLQLAEPASPT